MLDLCWKEDGAHLFLGGCGKTVKMLNLATSTATDIGTVRNKQDFSYTVLESECFSYLGILFFAAA